MPGRILLESVDLITQETQALDALAAYLHKQISNDGVLDLGDVKLVRSNKGDSFYTVTVKSCSCPAAFYNRGGPCKHQRKYFGQAHGQSMAQTLAEHDRNLYKMSASYQRMVRMTREEAEGEPLGLIHKGGFKPVCPEEA